MLCTGSINELLKMHIGVLDFYSKCKDSREASFHLSVHFRCRPSNTLRCGKTCVSPEKYPLRHGDETLDYNRMHAWRTFYCQEFSKPLLRESSA